MLHPVSCDTLSPTARSTSGEATFSSLDTGLVTVGPATFSGLPPAAPTRPVSSTVATPGSVLGRATSLAMLPPAATGSVLGAPATDKRTPPAAPSPTQPPLDVTMDVHAPILWHLPFPPHIQDALVSWDNPTGSITNSDLELAASVAHQDVLVHAFNLRECTINTGSDNTPTLFWQHKGSTTTTKALACLLLLQALYQWHHHYCPQFSHIPGPVNAMADDASHLWYLTDSQLLAYFDLVYLQPLLS